MSTFCAYLGIGPNSAPRTDRVPSRQAGAQEAVRRRSALGELLCYEAGQATPSHHHPKEDELFVILEGRAAVLAGDRELDAPAGSLVIVPATVPHDLRNVGNSRLVVMFVKLSRAFGNVAEP